MAKTHIWVLIGFSEKIHALVVKGTASTSLVFNAKLTASKTSKQLLDRAVDNDLEPVYPTNFFTSFGSRSALSKNEILKPTLSIFLKSPFLRVCRI